MLFTFNQTQLNKFNYMINTKLVNVNWNKLPISIESYFNFPSECFGTKNMKKDLIQNMR